MKLYTIPEAAAHLRCSARTVWRLVHSGQLESVPVGQKLRRVTQEQLERYLARPPVEQATRVRRQAPPINTPDRELTFAEAVDMSVWRNKRGRAS